jgi:hypothetical protein
MTAKGQDSRVVASGKQQVSILSYWLEVAGVVELLQYVYVRACACVHVYVCVYVYSYVHTHTHTHTIYIHKSKEFLITSTVVASLQVNACHVHWVLF